MMVVAGPSELITVIALPEKSMLSRRDENGIAVLRGVDARLDGGLIGGYVNGVLGPG
jgi:hypothetical protein